MIGRLDRRSRRGPSPRDRPRARRPGWKQDDTRRNRPAAPGPPAGGDRPAGVVGGERRVGAGVTVGVAGVGRRGLPPVDAGWADDHHRGVAAIVIGTSVGLVAGVTMGSRWAMLVAPVVFVAGFELV